MMWYDDYGIFRTLDYLPEGVTKIVIDGKFKGVKGPDLSPEKWRAKVKDYPNVPTPNIQLERLG